MAVLAFENNVDEAESNPRWQPSCSFSVRAWMSGFSQDIADVRLGIGSGGMWQALEVADDLFDRRPRHNLQSSQFLRAK
jgi:hypothetical protein